jgi:hypothetical protein
VLYKIQFEVLVPAKLQGMIRDGVAELCRGDIRGTQ